MANENIVVEAVRMIECTYPSLDDKKELKEPTVDGKQHKATMMLPIVDVASIKNPADLGKAIGKTLEMWEGIRQGSTCSNSKGVKLVPKRIGDKDEREAACATEERFIPMQIVGADFSPAAAYEAFLGGIIAGLRTAANQGLRSAFSAEEAETAGKPKGSKTIQSADDAFSPSTTATGQATGAGQKK